MFIKLALVGMVLAGVSLMVIGTRREDRALARMLKAGIPWPAFLPGEGMVVLGGTLIILAALAALIVPIIAFWLFVW